MKTATEKTDPPSRLTAAQEASLANYSRSLGRHQKNALNGLRTNSLPVEILLLQANLVAIKQKQQKAKSSTSSLHSNGSPSIKTEPGTTAKPDICDPDLTEYPFPRMHVKRPTPDSNTTDSTEYLSSETAIKEEEADSEVSFLSLDSCENHLVNLTQEPWIGDQLLRLLDKYSKEKVGSRGLIKSEIHEI